jgi:hypothetical protein
MVNTNTFPVKNAKAVDVIVQNSGANSDAKLGLDQRKERKKKSNFLKNHSG